MVLAGSYSRSLQLLARLDARTECKILERSPKGGWKLVVHIAVVILRRNTAIQLSISIIAKKE
jgi:hypothetical protein